MGLKTTFFLFAVTMVANISAAQSGASGTNRVLVDDFESYDAGDTPYHWKKVDGKNIIDVSDVLVRDDDYFEIIKDGQNNYLTAYVNNESTQIIRPVGLGYSWSSSEHPVLSWDWRANELPENASERNPTTNDVGAAVYVTFSRDILGRPKVIKYSYSSTLPVGTVVKFGRLVVIVTASNLDGIGVWKHMERNVTDDYRMAFGKNAPESPLAITLWSDTDNTRGIASVDFDNIELLSQD